MRPRLLGRAAAAVDAVVVRAVLQSRRRGQPIGQLVRVLTVVWWPHQRSVGECGSELRGHNPIHRPSTGAPPCSYRPRAPLHRTGPPMDTILIEWVNLLLRWLHVVAGMAWIGASFYFMHIDAHLRPADGIPQGKGGEAWEVHGGGFYQVRKYLVAPRGTARASDLAQVAGVLRPGCPGFCCWSGSITAGRPVPDRPRRRRARPVHRGGDRHRRT